jgi:rhodanese-related sulfurtransferase
MIRTTIIALAALMLLTSLACAAVQTIKSPEARSLLERQRNAFLLDVRTPDEFRAARLKGAVLIPINELERRLAEVPKGRPIVVYCAVGSRSGLVASFLAAKGYDEVYNVKDGIVGWYQNGYPIER